MNIEGQPFDRSDFVETLDLRSELRGNRLYSFPFVVSLSDHDTLRVIRWIYSTNL